MSNLFFKNPNYGDPYVTPARLIEVVSDTKWHIDFFDVDLGSWQSRVVDPKYVEVLFEEIQT